MTDAFDPHDRQTAELLRSLENDQTKVSQRRTEILADVLAHYDESLVVDDPVPLLVLLDDPPSLRNERPTVHRWLFAAVILLVAIGGAALLVGPDPPQFDAAGEPGGDAVQTSTLESRVEIFSGQVSFDGLEGLVVSERTPEVVLISRTADASGVADAIVLVDRGSNRVADRVVPLDTAGVIESSVVESRADGRQLYRWAINITQLGVSLRGCTINAPCLEIVEGVSESGITSSTQVTVTELLTSQGNRFLLMTDVNGPLHADLAELLASIEVR